MAKARTFEWANPEVKNAILERYIGGEPLSSIASTPCNPCTQCNDECVRAGMPSRQSIYRWMKADKEFKERIEDARYLHLSSMADELIIISNEEMKTQADVGRAKLRLDVRKWTLERFDRRRFGPGVQVEAHIQVSNRPIEELMAELAYLREQTADMLPVEPATKMLTAAVDAEFEEVRDVVEAGREAEKAEAGGSDSGNGVLEGTAGVD